VSLLKCAIAIAKEDCHAGLLSAGGRILNYYVEFAVVVKVAHGELADSGSVTYLSLNATIPLKQTLSLAW
jgi:hypothetical protein